MGEFFVLISCKTPSTWLKRRSCAFTVRTNVCGTSMPLRLVWAKHRILTRVCRAASLARPPSPVKCPPRNRAGGFAFEISSSAGVAVQGDGASAACVACLFLEPVVLPRSSARRRVSLSRCRSRPVAQQAHWCAQIGEYYKIRHRIGGNSGRCISLSLNRSREEAPSK